MVNMIADYLRCGSWTHQAFQLTGTDDAELAVKLLLAELRAQSCEPACIVVVHGDYRLEELEEVQAGVFEIFYCDPELVQRAGKGVR